MAHAAAAARPLVTVRRSAKAEKIPIPHVLLAPIRPDIVHFVHTNMAKNRRQPYAVNPRAGHQHSAESWGTGRAVARIPRVSGSGTNRAGQAAFGNMCRKGRMFAPTKIWRRWHRHISVNQRRYAVASALAASAIPALVMARGHRIAKVAEVPLVVGDAIESIEKTRDAVKFLKSINAYQDVVRARDSKKLRAGKGKLRNRRYVQRRGPLVVFSEDKGVTRAFRNLPGVDLAHVERLNLLQLAPGGHLGRFIIWSKSAFEKLDSIWGSTTHSPKAKKGYNLPANVVFNSDITRIINSDEVQSKVRPAKKANQRYRLKKNPLKNLGAMVKLNPYILQVRRRELLVRNAVNAQKANRAAGKKTKAPAHVAKRVKNLAKFKKTHEAAKKAFFKRLASEGDQQ